MEIGSSHQTAPSMPLTHDTPSYEVSALLKLKRIGSAATAHDAFLRPICSCAGDLAKQLASRAGGKIIRCVWYYQHRISPILSFAGNMSCQLSGKSNLANDIMYCDHVLTKWQRPTSFCLSQSLKTSYLLFKIVKDIDLCFSLWLYNWFLFIF